jgi:hypothetical protein
VRHERVAPRGLAFSLQKLLSTGAITFAFKVRAHEQYEAVIV